MTSKSLTQNDEHDIPSQILKTVLIASLSYFFRPQFSSYLHLAVIPNSSGQLAELIVYTIPLE